MTQSQMFAERIRAALKSTGRSSGKHSARRPTLERSVHTEKMTARTTSLTQVPAQGTGDTFKGTAFAERLRAALEDTAA